MGRWVVLLLLLLFLPAGGCRIHASYAGATDVAAMEALRSSLEIQARDTLKEIRVLRGEIARNRKEIERLGREKAELVARLKPLLATVENLREDVRAAGERVSSDKKRLAALEKEKKQVAAALASKEKELEGLRARQKKILVELPALRKEVAELEKKGTPEFRALWKRREELLKEGAALSKALRGEVERYEAARRIFEEALKKARAASRPASRPASGPSSRPAGSAPGKGASKKGKRATGTW